MATVSCFNSRPHEEVDVHFQVQVLSDADGFNSRPHEEVDSCNGDREGREDVSTHDLTKRSTSCPFTHINRILVFQLTTSRRGRRRLWHPLHCHYMFQLTTSRRGRQQFLRKKFSFQNHFLCSLHIIYSYYINTIFFSTLFLAKSSFFLVRIL